MRKIQSLSYTHNNQNIQNSQNSQNSHNNQNIHNNKNNHNNQGNLRDELYINMRKENNYVNVNGNNIKIGLGK